MPDRLALLLAEVRACTRCAAHLPLGQAPGRKVHDSGVPFDDASGERLRAWLGVSRGTFYDARQIAILPVGFCYPGTGASGDLPPRPECAPAWRAAVLSRLQKIELTLVIGQYAQAYHLPGAGASLTDTVQAWCRHWPHTVALPHPSPRNNLWLKRHPWFEEELVPPLRARVAEVLVDTARGAFPGLPLVGYEHGPSLALARACGFEALGPLRVWQRRG